MKNPPVEATIIPARCSQYQNRLYGIRAEKINKQWVMTWANPLSEHEMKVDKLDQSKIRSSFNVTSDYPGCPFCKGTGTVVCYQCGKITCYHGESSLKCGWCHTVLDNIETVDEIDLSGTGI